MYCMNCAQHVENALNVSGFRWAKADIGIINKNMDIV